MHGRKTIAIRIYQAAGAFPSQNRHNLSERSVLLDERPFGKVWISRFPISLNRLRLPSGLLHGLLRQPE